MSFFFALYLVPRLVVTCAPPRETQAINAFITWIKIFKYLESVPFMSHLLKVIVFAALFRMNYGVAWHARIVLAMLQKPDSLCGISIFQHHVMSWAPPRSLRILNPKP
jgi:hypothetical protein